MADILISCARPDRDKVEHLERLLRSAGLNAHLTYGRIPPGIDYQRFIERELADADLVIVCWSAESVDDEHVRREAERAWKLEKLFPLRLDDVQPPRPFDELHTFDLVGWHADHDDARTRQLIADTRSRIRESSLAQSAPPSDAPSWPHPTAAAPVRVDRSRLAMALLAGVALFSALLFGAYYGLDDRRVASLLARPAPPAPAIQPTRDIRNLDVVDLDVFYPGFDLPGMPTTATAPDDCRRQCRERPDCGAFSHVVVDHFCYLKSAAQSERPRPGTISGRIARSPLATAN
jgi:hypothetical protein